MKKNFEQKINHVVDRLNFKFSYIIANTVMKKKVDSENGFFNIMSDKELVDSIVNERKSFARFGDGELSLILEKKFDCNFQFNSEKLRKRLKEVLNSDNEKVIIGINRSFNNANEYSQKVQKNCRTFNYLYRNKYKSIIPSDKIYGNSSITRFYIDYDNSNFSEAISRFNNIKRIWHNRKVLIVEGKQSKLGVGNHLFEDTISIRRILIPETNAFSLYSEIFSAVLDSVGDQELVLLAAGPTATILAYDLSMHGIQAIDIGHVDIEYEWMRLKTNKRVAIKGKYVNEIKGQKYIESDVHDLDYESQIILEVVRNA